MAEDTYALEQTKLTQKETLQRLADDHKLAAAQRGRRQAEEISRAHEIQTKPLRDTMAALTANGIEPRAALGVIQAVVSSIEPLTRVDEQTVEGPEAKTQQMRTIDPTSLPKKGEQ